MLSDGRQHIQRRLYRRDDMTATEKTRGVLGLLRVIKRGDKVHCPPQRCQGRRSWDRIQCLGFFRLCKAFGGIPPSRNPLQ